MGSHQIGKSAIIGGGLLASAFGAQLSGQHDMCLFASGVSDSTLSDKPEFLREEHLLRSALQEYRGSEAFIYFGTCGVYDPSTMHSRYVRHKMAMERIVLSTHNGVVVRLPQVAGHGGNRRNFLRFMVDSIRDEVDLDVWSLAYRNIIDVDDVVRILLCYMDDGAVPGEIVNVANKLTVPVLDVVSVIEKILGKKAKMNLVKKGDPYMIDIGRIERHVNQAGVIFDDAYVRRVLLKYYL